MGDNFYHRPPHDWNRPMNSQDCYAQQLLRVLPRDRVDLAMTRGNRLPHHLKPESNLLAAPHPFSSSTSSSPVSSTSYDDCHDSAERLHSISCISTVNSLRHRPRSQKYDTPIDLSKPKSQDSQNDLPKSSETRLSRLLTRKRRSEDENCCDQARPLNLSTKGCTVRAWSEPALGDVVDMKDAVNNPVQLAQILNEQEVAQQVMQYLTEMINKIFALKQFHSIQEPDKIRLVVNCWHRLLLWIFADNKFAFQVRSLSCTPHCPGESSSHQIHQPQLNHPSMAFVRSVAAFIQRYESLKIDKEELRQLFFITLFHTTENQRYIDADQIAQHRKTWMRELQSYTISSERGGAQRYSDLLLYLPMLYGINGKMVEELFFQHLTAHVSINTLLTEAIKSFQPDGEACQAPNI
ncbi:orphan steroid hormone receptor 2-like [Watersipora subatra]|uniref:orphan steroid hormone receptor 2-like n=1 Tax=Watersipora subatra TaxID=2589382 RepID=UPI00355B3632